MAFDTSGTFTRTAGIGDTGATVWQDDAAAGTKILASRHDTHDQDLASGLSQCLTRHGWGVPSVDIPWGGKRITNLNDPVAQQDAATKHYVDNPDAAPHARAINGADLDGRLNFTALSGTNGITWTYADLAWVARHSVVGEANDRLVLAGTVAPDTTGPAAGLADVFIVDDAGRINSSGGRLTNNVSYEGAATRTISPGTGTILSFGVGIFNVSSNDTATITNNYASFTPRIFFQVQNASNGTFVSLDKAASGDYARIQSSMAGDARWVMDLGNNTAETATDRVGSDFVLQSYSNAGNTPFTEMTINRLTHKVTFGGEVALGGATGTMGASTAGSGYVMHRPIDSGYFNIYGGSTAATGAYLTLYGETHATNGGDFILGTNSSYRYLFDFSANRHFWANNTSAAVMDLTATGDLSIAGTLSFANNLVSSTAQSLLATTGAGTVYLRPNGAGSIVGQVTIDNTGDMTLGTVGVVSTGGVYAGKGIRGKVGSNATGYGSYFQNFNWNGSTLAAYADVSIIGNLSYTVSDYRIKKDVTPLGSMWDKVKALKPISYTQRAFQVWTEDDTPRLGFLAHELRESIEEGAVLGEKDGPDVQFINPMAVIAALTKALQEAMSRIEALEAAA